MVDLRLKPTKRGKTFKHVDRFVAPRATLEERFAAGKALRDTLPRERHATYQPKYRS